MKARLLRLPSIVFCLGLSLHPASADTGRIRIEVVDPSGKPIPHLRIEATYRTNSEAPSFSLPPSSGSAETDDQGKAELILSRPANSISASDGEWFATSEISEGQSAVRLTATPFFISDFTSINQSRPRETREVIRVGVVGNVKRPGYYMLPRDASAWVALEQAGGFTAPKDQAVIDVHRDLGGQNNKPSVVFILSWQRRAKETVPLLLSDGDIIGVDTGFGFGKALLQLKQK